MARAVWYVAPGKVELRTAPLAPPMPGQALVRTLYTGVSRGTERLVLAGAVGQSEWERMQAPMQEGQFPFPVKYGYCATGVVEVGPKELLGQTVFALHPHQDCFVAPVEMLALVPATVPARRATLAANMETALNALWDSGAGPADRIVVVGAGVVGLLIAYLAARLPGADVTVIDVALERQAVVAALGARFAVGVSPSPHRLHSDGERVGVRGGGTRKAEPAAAPHIVPEARLRHDNPLPVKNGERGYLPTGADVVFHTSVSAAGLDCAIACAGFEATVVELSWYGDREVPVKLGGAFHSQRLKLVSSQVGHISAGRRVRWDYRRRLNAALNLLADPRLDALVAEDIAFDDAASALPKILGAGARGLAPVIRYPGA